MNEERIQVLLAVKNGEAFLVEQLESLKSQTNIKIQLIAGFAHSNDNSRKILESYSESFDGFKLIKTDSGSSTGDFLHLISVAKPNLPTAFCDQDDVWYPTKLEESLRELRKLSGSAAVTVGWDRVNSAGELDGRGFKPDNSVSIESLLFQNRYIGCSLLLNEIALADCQSNLELNKKHIFAHDWWVLLLVSSLGEVKGIGKPLMAYRIHNLNTIGIPQILSLRWFRNRFKASWAQDVKKQLMLVSAYVENRVSSENAKLLKNSIGFLIGTPRATLQIFIIPRSLRSNLLDEILLRMGGLARIGIHLVRRILANVRGGSPS